MAVKSPSPWARFRELLDPAYPIRQLLRAEVARLKTETLAGQTANPESANRLAHLVQLADHQRSGKVLAVLVAITTALLALALFLHRSTPVEIDFTTTTLEFRLGRQVPLFPDLELLELNLEGTGATIQETLTGKPLLPPSDSGLRLAAGDGCKLTLHGFSAPAQTAVALQPLPGEIEVTLTAPGSGKLGLDGSLGGAGACKVQSGSREEELRSANARFTLPAAAGPLRFRARYRGDAVSLMPRLPITQLRLHEDRDGHSYSPLLSARISYDKLPKKEEPIREGDWLSLQPAGEANLRRVRLEQGRVAALFHGEVIELEGGANEKRELRPTYFESLQDHVKLGLLVLYIALVLWKSRGLPSASELGG